jgi:GTP pyrophosphokinase
VSNYSLPEISSVDAQIIRLASASSIWNLFFYRDDVTAIEAKMGPILHELHTRYPRAPLEPVMQAFRFASLAHQGQFRQSGDQYITHPIAVAEILADLGMDVPTIMAALLHDTIEDTDVSYDDVRALFGENIAELVNGVTKFSKVEYGDSANAETIRKMIVAMSKDIRVLIIKLADRLHNARTWKFVPLEKSERKARETLDIYAPLAHRLGLNQVKRELEDLSFFALHPKVYNEIDRLVGLYAPEREKFVDKVLGDINAVLNSTGIKATVSGRPKHYYSIYQKMIIKGREFRNIYDLVGFRIITETLLDCYAALGAIHAKWNHLPNRFKDYIAMPKYNMYKSIHTTIIEPEMRPVEVQIRTKEMHEFAQFGVAAHWRYKQKHVSLRQRSTRDESSEFNFSEESMPWIKQIIDWQKETDDPGEFFDALRFDLNSDEVYVFTPKGYVLALPIHSTPVDFAYSIHTEVGHKTMGTRVNGRLVSLDSELKNGDTVEILTTKSETAGPNRDWLLFVKSQRARNKIRAWFAKGRRESNIEKGKDILADAFRGKGVPVKRVLTHQILSETSDELKQSSIDELYRSIGNGNVTATAVLGHILMKLGAEVTNEIVDEPTAAGHVSDTIVAETSLSKRLVNPGIAVSGVESENDVWIKLAKCCTPAPGDEIVGFVTKGQGVSVHRVNCFNLAVLREDNEPGRFVDVNWIQGVSHSFVVQIQVEGLDRPKLLVDVTKILGDNHASILSGQIETTKDRVALSRWTFEIGDLQHLAILMAAIRKIDGVFDVYRVSGKKMPEKK